MSQWFHDEPSGVEAGWINGFVNIELDPDDAYEFFLTLRQMQDKTRITMGVERALEGILQ